MADETHEAGDPAQDAPANLGPPVPYEKKEREPDPEPPGAPEWVVTFTDMISLLVTFFVLLMTFSSMEEYDMLRYQSLVQGSRGTLDNFRGPRAIELSDPDIISDTHPLDGALDPHSRDDIPEERSEFGRADGPNTVEVDLNEIGDGMLVTWDRDAAYRVGALEPNSTLKQALAQVGEVLRHYPHLIVVEPHTANDFVPGRGYATAEDFSMARARAAADYLIEAGGITPERIQLAGYGASRPRSLNDSVTGRMSNRRIELRILAVPRSREQRLEVIRRASNDAIEEGR